MFRNLIALCLIGWLPIVVRAAPVDLVCKLSDFHIPTGSRENITVVFDSAVYTVQVNTPWSAYWTNQYHPDDNFTTVTFGDATVTRMDEYEIDFTTPVNVPQGRLTQEGFPWIATWKIDRISGHLTFKVLWLNPNDNQPLGTRFTDSGANCTKASQQF